MRVEEQANYKVIMNSRNRRYRMRVTKNACALYEVQLTDNDIEKLQNGKTSINIEGLIITLVRKNDS